MASKEKLIIIIVIICLATVVFIFNSDKENVQEQMSDKELKQRIGQMLIVGFRDTEITENSPIVKAIKDLNLGGIILFDYDVPLKSFPRNILNPEQTKKLTRDLQSFSETPLFITIDAEGGKINRLKEKYGFINMPSHQELGIKNNLEITKQVSSALASELDSLGINTNFAPVVDLNINPENPVIGSLERSFSEKPEIVINHAFSFIKSHQEKNIITVLKHFPGHGSSKGDSHQGMVDVTNTYEEKELIPFKELIDKKIVDIVMTAHIINKNIDPSFPATLSSLFIKGILRQDFGFQGIVVSDDIQMGAIEENYGFEEALILAINAGCDMLILSNNGDKYDENISYKARDIIFQAVKRGDILLSQIIESSNRINDLKEKRLLKN